MIKRPLIEPGKKKIDDDGVVWNQEIGGVHGPTTSLSDIFLKSKIILKTLGGVGGSGFLVAILLMVHDYRVKTAEWRTNVEFRIAALEKNNDGIKNKKSGDGKKGRYNTEDTQAVDCYIGRMRTTYASSEKTTPCRWQYDTNDSVAQINEAYLEWSVIGLPSCGDFIEIVNSKNGFNTWVMVIGTFRNNFKKKHAMIVTKKAASKLFDVQYHDGIRMRIRILEADERRSDSERMKLLKKYGVDY